MTLDNQIYKRGSISSSKWALGQTPVAEALGIYNLIRDITAKTKHLNSGEIVVYIDMKKVVKEVNIVIEKESQYVRKASASVLGIRKEIEESNVTIKLEYSSTNVRSNDQFTNRLGPFLMKECDKQSKLDQKQL